MRECYAYVCGLVIVQKYSPNDLLQFLVTESLIFGSERQRLVGR